MGTLGVTPRPTRPRVLAFLHLVIGAYAVGIHGRPRATKDLDVWVEASAENAVRVMHALRAFGAPLGDLTEADLAQVGTGFKMGSPPRRIDILTSAPGFELRSSASKTS